MRASLPCVEPGPPPAMVDADGIRGTAPQYCEGRDRPARVAASVISRFDGGAGAGERAEGGREEGAMVLCKLTCVRPRERERPTDRRTERLRCCCVGVIVVLKNEIRDFSTQHSLAHYYVGYTTDPVAHECAAPAVTKRLIRIPLLSFTMARSEQP